MPTMQTAHTTNHANSPHHQPCQRSTLPTMPTAHTPPIYKLCKYTNSPQKNQTLLFYRIGPRIGPPLLPPSQPSSTPGPPARPSPPVCPCHPSLSRSPSLSQFSLYQFLKPSFQTFSQNLLTRPSPPGHPTPSQSSSKKLPFLWRQHMNIPLTNFTRTSLYCSHRLSSACSSECPPTEVH